MRRTSRDGTMRDGLERRVGWPVWAVTAAVFVVFLAVVLPAEADRSLEALGTSEVPDSSLFYTAADLERLAGEYGEDGRAYYIRSRFTFDVVWPLAYGAFLQASLLVASRRTVLGRLPGPVIAAPILAMLFDLLENSSASLVMARYPDPTPLVAQAAPLFTLTKWALIAASFGLIAAGGIADLIGRLRGHHGSG